MILSRLGILLLNVVSAGLGQEARGQGDTEAVDWVNGTVSGEVTEAVSVPEGVVEREDPLSRGTKVEEGRECSHLPFR